MLAPMLSCDTIDDQEDKSKAMAKIEQFRQSSTSTNWLKEETLHLHWTRKWSIMPQRVRQAFAQDNAVEANNLFMAVYGEHDYGLSFQILGPMRQTVKTYMSIGQASELERSLSSLENI